VRTDRNRLQFAINGHAGFWLPNVRHTFAVIFAPALRDAAAQLPHRENISCGPQ
jgi:hypothetical protein